MFQIKVVKHFYFDESIQHIFYSVDATVKAFTALQINMDMAKWYKGRWQDD